ncbi:metal ABC transporter ATPase [Pseudomonas sp. N040]|uniref:metal ABC transporter ATPase n=1 Tax=Pseudomonas sp. N040 TaxID=2785325 RepID=UPI0018A26C4C|nr:metal ABC transporter ATPase [Pseudomonas sp. N040]MBF7730187.1 metal ABC transporter ATPase [Pseudomonas sp. N040]MBW7013829.1 metal ABC transporter ATPase [Pseudomonas sp. N040]
MPRTLARKDPAAFKTLPLRVEARAGRLSYQGHGLPLNFAQMLERRCPLEVADARQFSVQLANLGVSVRLTLHWRGRDHWVLVRQRRPDRGDTVLKLISGYVPAHELNLPLLTALQEVAEECLVETSQGWLDGRFAETWLPTPYRGHLHHRDDCHYRVVPLSGAAHAVHAGSLPLLERPRAYVHLPTASLQLVYDMRLELPGKAHLPSLYHVDEQLENGQLLARLDRRRGDLFLLPLQQDHPGGELFRLAKGQLQAVSCRGLWLSESFAEQDGWLVRAQRIAWKDWLARQRG